VIVIGEFRKSRVPCFFGSDYRERRSLIRRWAIQRYRPFLPTRLTPIGKPDFEHDHEQEQEHEQEGH
jgi:hypothetical protein